MGPKDSNPPKYTGQLLRLYYSRLKSGLSKKLFEKRRISAGDRETGILPGDGRRGVEEHAPVGGFQHGQIVVGIPDGHDLETDRKSTRLNSSHSSISYAVFCLKKN